MNNREAFEAWAVTHGGLDITKHEAMDNKKLPFPCTYYDYTTEIAWRAFANKKESAQAALASQAQQEPSINLNHSDIALLKQWFNAVQDLNPKYLNEGDFQLLAKLQSQEQQTESQWKPIATAPKNKKIIVRYKNVCDKERTVFAKYIEEFTEEANSETECETDYHEERDTYYFKEGWVEMIDNWDEFSCVYFDSRNVPTHWMDIPPAPEGDKP